MHNWTIEYWLDADGKSSVEVWLDNLTKEQLKSVAKELKLLELSGNRLRLPHSRTLGQGLFELRERNFGYRIYYGFASGSIIILLHAGDKSSQQKDIALARKRLASIK